MTLNLDRLHGDRNRGSKFHNILRTSMLSGPFAAESLEVHVVRDDDDAVLGPPHVHLEHLRPAILDCVPEGE